MNIGNFEIGTGRTFIIAECCSNIIPHLHNLESIVKQVASTGADALKIQLYKADHFPESERVNKKRTEFPRDVFPQLVKLCHSVGIICGTSVFDEEAVDIVIESGGDFLKLATREWDNVSLWQVCCSTGLPIIQSFDCRIISDLAFPAYQDTLYMGCIPEYPADRFRFPVLTGKSWSSHTNHWRDCLIAVSRMAYAIEKHIKFAANDYEAGWSLYPEQFQQMVKDIRWVEEAR